MAVWSSKAYLRGARERWVCQLPPRRWDRANHGPARGQVGAGGARAGASCSCKWLGARVIANARCGAARSSLPRWTRARVAGVLVAARRRGAPPAAWLSRWWWRGGCARACLCRCSGRCTQWRPACSARAASLQASRRALCARAWATEGARHPRRLAVSAGPRGAGLHHCLSVCSLCMVVWK